MLSRTSAIGGANASSCRTRPPTQQTTPDQGPGFNPFPNTFALIPRTGSAYIVNIGGASILSVTSISRCNATDTAGFRRPATSMPDSEFMTLLRQQARGCRRSRSSPARPLSHYAHETRRKADQ